MAERRRHRREPRQPPDEAAALEIAARFLGARPRTRWELERRLLRAGASHEVVEATLRRLQGLGYVDDEAFGRWWLQQRDRHAPRGRRMLVAELRQRGVPRAVIVALRGTEPNGEERPDEDGLPTTELDRARQALGRHLRGRPLPSDSAAQRRLGMFLMRRGFDVETVRSVLRSASAADDEVADELP
jgi:regulatory protein